MGLILNEQLFQESVKLFCDDQLRATTSVFDMQNIIKSTKQIKRIIYYPDIQLWVVGNAFDMIHDMIDYEAEMEGLLDEHDATEGSAQVYAFPVKYTSAEDIYYKFKNDKSGKFPVLFDVLLCYKDFFIQCPKTMVDIWLKGLPNPLEIKDTAEFDPEFKNYKQVKVYNNPFLDQMWDKYSGDVSALEK